MSYNDMLNKILLNPDTDAIEGLIELWLLANEVEYIKKSHMQYKIVNGCEANIMLYPSKHKIMIQTEGRNYVQTASCDALIGVIKGTLPFKRPEVKK